MFEERTAPSEHRARPSSRSGGEIPSIESVAAVCFFCGTSVSSPSPLKAISLRRSALFLALAPLPPSFRRDMIYCLASVPLTRTDGRATQSVEQMSKTDKKYLPMALKRHTSLAPPHRPLPPFKKCAKFNLIRSPDSDRPLPSLPIQLLFLSPFRGPPPPRFTSLYCRDDSTFSQTDCRSNWGSAAAATPSPDVGTPIVAMIAALAATASQADEVSSLSLADMHARKPSESQKGRDPLSRFFPPSPTMPRSPVLAFLDKCA